MKYFIRVSTILFMILGLTFGAQAQRKKVINLPKYDLEPYHFGFILAANQMHYSLKLIDGFQFVSQEANAWPDEPNNDSIFLYGLNSVPTPGFTIGIVGNLRLGNYFDLRFIPSLSFGERHLDYSIMRWRDGEGELIEVRKSNPSTFVEFPLHIKYRSKRLNNAAAYLLGGINYKLDLASQKKKIVTVSDGSSYFDGIKTNQSDLSVEIGIGWDFYTNFFKFGTELKMSYGLSNTLIKDNLIYSSSLNSMSNKVFQLSFTFE